METFGFRADGGARNKPLHDCSNERAAEADECCEDFGRHVIGGEVSQMANARLTEQIFDGGFCASVCTKGDSGNLSGAAVCYALDSKMTNMPYVT